MSVLIGKTSEFCEAFELSVHKEPDGSINTLSLLKKATDFLDEEVDETKKAIEEDNAAETIDGFGDVAFVALNGIYKYFRGKGCTPYQSYVQTTETMHRICDANLRKRQPDGTVKFKNKKVVKPEGWQPPEFDDLFDPEILKNIVDPFDKKE